jgi:CBS domain-containing protein
MKTSVIRQRVADFLKQHPPFDALPEEDLLLLAGSGKVAFHESEEYIVREGQTAMELLWVIQQGCVEIAQPGSEGEVLRDVLEAGDLIGLHLFQGGGPSPVVARTTSDVILYGISASAFQGVCERNPGVQRFVAAHRSLSATPSFARESWLDAEAPPLQFLQARTRAVAGDGRQDAIHRAPVLSASALTTRSAIRSMLANDAELLAIAPEGVNAEGGLPGAGACALLTAQDLALFCLHNPMAILRVIRDAGSAAEIKPLIPPIARMVRGALAHPADAADCCHLQAMMLRELMSAGIRVADLELSGAGFSRPGVPHCWLVFGSAARGDLLHLQFPTLAAVYDDRSPAMAPEDSMYFTAVAGLTAEWFHELGLSGPGFYWPEGARPSMPLSEWQRLYRETIQDPLGHDLYARREFFDVALVSGADEVLGELLREIGLQFSSYPQSRAALARATLDHVPPLTFFQGLVLGMDGSRQESFHVEESILSPVAQAARLFVLGGDAGSAATLARLEAAGRRLPEHEPIIRQAAEAFRVGLFYRETTGSADISPRQLQKFDQLLLKRAFESVRGFLALTGSIFSEGQ